MLIVLAVSLVLTLVFEEGFALLWGLRGRGTKDCGSPWQDCP